jgi:SNF2 family DNA or RNA helicase
VDCRGEYPPTKLTTVCFCFSGKTLIGCVWIRSFQKSFENCKAIVICPVSLKEEWSRTAIQATELNVLEEETKSKKKKNAESSNDNKTSNVEIFSWSKVPTTVDSGAQNYVVVCDEAHSIQSMQAARTKDLLTLVKPKRCVGVLLLTGTPMKNGKPSNLFPLLKAVGHPFGNHQKAYETQFCNGRQKNFGRGGPVWDASGSSNLEQLRELASSHLLHLTKDECMKTLPKSTRVHKHIPVSFRLQMQYTKALQDMVRINVWSVLLLETRDEPNLFLRNQYTAKALRNVYRQ